MLYVEISGRGKLAIVLSAVTMFLTIVSTVLRIYSRSLLTRTIAVDDYLMIVALICFLFLTTMTIISVCAGVGHHIHNLTLHELSGAVEYLIIASLGYIMSGLFARLSVTALYLRLTTVKWQHYILWIYIVVLSAYSIAFFFLSIFWCWPVDYIWTQFLGTEGHCVISATTFRNMSYGLNATSILWDWSLALMPIALLWNSNMGTQTKVITCGLLGLGAFASIASIIRLTELHSLNTGIDYTYNEIPVLVWSIVECAVGIIAGNGATLRPLIVKVFGRMHSVADNRSRNRDVDDSTPSTRLLSKRFTWSSKAESKNRYSDDTTVEINRIYSLPPKMDQPSFGSEDDFEKSMTPYFEAYENPSEVDLVDLKRHDLKGYGLID